MQDSERKKVLITVHGTGDATAQSENPKWWQKESEFVRTEFPDAEIHIVAHSHGGNVVLDSLNGLTVIQDRVKSVLLVGTPHLRRASTVSEYAYFVLAMIALLPLLMLSANAEPFLNYCVHRPGMPENANWLEQLFFTNPDIYAGVVPGDTNCPDSNKTIFLKEPWFLFPMTAILFSLSCMIAESRRRFLYLGTLNVLLILLWLAVTYLPDNKAGFSLFNHIVLQFLIWSAGSLMAGYLFRRAVEIELDRRRWARAFSLFADRVTQVYHNKDEAIDLLRSVRTSRIVLASRDQAARLLEAFLLGILVTAFIVLTIFLAVFLLSNVEDEFVSALLGEELINSDTLILHAIIAIPLVVGLSFFLLNLLSMWLGEAVSEAGAAIANDEMEMSRVANDAIQSTIRDMIEVSAFSPSGILANPSLLASMITYREVVHCGYFETDFIADLIASGLVEDL